MAPDPLSYFGIWYWPEDENSEACYTAVCDIDHYDCNKGWFRYPNVQHPMNWLDTEIELQIGTKVIVEWKE